MDKMEWGYSGIRRDILTFDPLLNTHLKSLEPTHGMNMANENNHMGFSPTVLLVVETFVAAMRADPAIADGAITRLDNFLRKGTIPKPDEINAILFEPTPEGHT